MKSSTRLEYAVFQLTPTRTRCELVIVANGKTEKIASGLIDPFLAHLKYARDQFAKGGYSIVLKPESSSDPERWFTKHTVERFVCFVNTPVVLERVHSLESEILQIEKAIMSQSHDDINSSKVENVHSKPAESTQGSMEEDKGTKPIPNVNEEKAIVLYEPSTLADEETTAYLSEENSKVQLVKVLETRKSFLQKEQKMAFARALASGFDIDHMAPLISFAECFTASRFMDACTRFVNIWKAKNDIGQWLETEGAYAASSQLDYATMATAGITLSGVAGKEMNLVGPLPESAIEPGPDNNSSHQSPGGSQNHIHGQFSQPVYSPWGVASPPGLPVFQGYPVQGMPYYQSYPGHSPFTYPPYRSPDGVESGSHLKSHSFENNGISKSESRKMTDTERTSQYNSDLEKEASDNRGLHRKTRSSKKNPGTVVIRNINYITAKRLNDSESESTSSTDDESDKNVEDTSVRRSTTRQIRCTESVDLESTMNGQLGGKANAGHWHAFQNCLMRNAEEIGGADHALFSMEKGAKTKPHLTALDKDPTVDSAQYQSAHGASVYLNPSGDTHSMQRTSRDELLSTNIGIHGDQGIYKDASIDIQLAERDGSVIRYRNANDHFMVHRQQIQPNYTMSSADMCSVNMSTDGTQNVTGDSFILPSRPTAPLENGTAKIDGIAMNYELPSSHPNTDSCRIRNQETYEPEDLGWIADRGTLQDLTGYNPAVDYEMEVNINKSAVGNSRKDTGSNKKDNNQKPKVASGTLDSKRSLGPIKRAKPSKMSPIEEARARAEKLRSFKADLQKQKKEKEEEQKKRIESLKIERQKRIIARSSVAPSKSVQPSPQVRKQLLTKASPGTLKGSKFSDSEPGFSSPLQGVSRRTLSLGAIDSCKTQKPKSNAVTPSSVNKVNRSVSSLSELKTVEGIVTPEPKASMSRIRRLSEPRKSTNHISSARRLNGASVAKAITSSGPESGKVSAMMNLDKTKAATLPDLKIRIPDSDTHTGDMCLEKSIVKQMTSTGNQPNPARTSLDSEVEHNKVVVQQSAGDATSGVENDIATLEYEKHSVVDEHKAKEVTGRQEFDHRSERVMVMADVNREPRANKLKVQFDAHEIMKSTAEKDLSKSSEGETAKPPYQAPFEELRTGNSGHAKAISTSSNKETSLSVAATEASARQLRFESVQEVLDKPCVKEPYKGGFKRLLKFGKKNISSSGDHNSEIASISRASSEGHQCAANGTSSNRAPTLKNLISHDETEIASTPPPKSSRHFSLLSPFRKSSEKKIIIL